MGLAASQARLLQLNSRKSDLEFQGQQINQQRTILSDQTETFYNQILALDVPDASSYPVNDDESNDPDGDGLSTEYEAALVAYSTEYNRINAKIETVHEQDRALETTLRNVDTQHNAVQTEIDAVKKVIDKNIELTFKTFQ